MYPFLMISEQQKFTRLEDAGIDLEPAVRPFPW